MRLISLRGAVASTTFAIALMGASIASAATVGVTTGSPVGVAAAFERGTTNNDFVGANMPLQVNLDTIFDLDSWVYLAKFNFDGESENAGKIGLSDFSTTNGDFTILDSVWAMYDSFILVLKGGGGNTTEPNYLAYSLTSANGTYTSPFLNPKNGNPKGISHISLYGTGDNDGGTGGPGDVSPVPLPAGLPMLLSAIAGMAYLRKRKLQA